MATATPMSATPAAVTPPMEEFAKLFEESQTRQEMRQGGMVATAVLVFIALFTILIVWIA